MSLSAPCSERTTRRSHGDERLRRRTAHRLGSPERKEEARRASEKLASMVWKSVVASASAAAFESVPPSEPQQQHGNSLLFVSTTDSRPTTGGGVAVTGALTENDSPGESAMFWDRHQKDLASIYEDESYGNDGNNGDHSSFYSFSEHSSERAVRRGRQRGALELNEARDGESCVGSVVSDDLVSFDITTLSGTSGDVVADMTEFGAGPRKRQKRRQKELAKKTSRSYSSSADMSWKKRSSGFGKQFGRALKAAFIGVGGSRASRNGTTKQPLSGGYYEKENNDAAPAARGAASSSEAWMCGVCGKAFCTEEAAEKHENEHIRQVVNALGWTTTKTDAAAGAPAATVVSNGTSTAGGGGDDHSQPRQQQQRQQEQDSPLSPHSPSSAMEAAHRVVEEVFGPQLELEEQRQKGQNSKGKSKLDPFASAPAGVPSGSGSRQHPARMESEGISSAAALFASNMAVVTHKGDLLLEEEEFVAMNEEEKREESGVGNDDDDDFFDLFEGEDYQRQEAAPIEGGMSQMVNIDGSPLKQQPPQPQPQPQPIPTPPLKRPLFEVPQYPSFESARSARSERDTDSPNVPDRKINGQRWEPKPAPGAPAAGTPTAGPLVCRPNRKRTGSEVRFADVVMMENDVVAVKDDIRGDDHNNAVLMPSTVRDYVVLADEALVDVCRRAKPMILTPAEILAERELSLLSKDKSYYDELAQRAHHRNSNPSNRFRSDGEDVFGKVQNKLLDAYQLMKEGDGRTTGGVSDQYNRKQKGDSANSNAVVSHTADTLYVNVMVKNSIQVVKHELERLARERWEENVENTSRFERFRVYAHSNIVKLAGLALASDFTPRRIAVQLSNDLYRLLTPRLKRRGVTIETEIEYRVGPYFVLAVNIQFIDWKRLIKATYRDLSHRRAKWEEEQHELVVSAAGDEDGDDDEAKKTVTFLRNWVDYMLRLWRLSMDDVLAQVLAWFYHVHWIIYLPICATAYRLFLGNAIRHFIVTGVTDEIFYYVEQKGMEMEIQIRNAANQAAFMLSALREIRADGREMKKKQQQTEGASGEEALLGPLLGPSIKEDKAPAPEIPEGFEVPDNLEFVVLDLEIDCGFQRVRWAMCHSESKFVLDALWRVDAKYENITRGSWSKNDEHIGTPTAKLPAGIDVQDFLQAEREASYLMPKSAFVKANMAYETANLIAYNDYCFCIRTKSLTPDVPFGNSFVAWTQMLVINAGNGSVKVYFSVEPEFPNGPPMVARQIESGMRAGTLELFVLIGKSITKYAEAYP